MNIAQLIITAAIVPILFFPNPSITSQKLQINYKYVIPYTNQDLQCLAKNIYFEARGENTQGKLAVAQVTLNRVIYSGDSRSTICGIVYQKNQFSWTKLPRLKIKNLQQWEESLHIANGILAGKLFLANFDALYFHSSYVKPQWRVTKQYIRTIGKHIFYL